MISRFKKFFGGLKPEDNPNRLTFDPQDQAFVDNPYPCYEYLRQNDPLHRTEDGFFVLTRYADVQKALSEAKLTNEPSPYSVVGKRNVDRFVSANVASNILPYLAGVQHQDLRKLLGRAFHDQVRRNPPDLEGIAKSILASFKPDQEIDILKDFATPYSIRVISSLLGIPEKDENQLKDWSHSFFYLFAKIPSVEIRKKIDDDLKDFRNYFSRQLKNLRKNSEDSFMGALVKLQESESELEDSAIIDNLMLFFADGVENVDRGIASGLFLIHQTPQAWADLCSYPEKVTDYVDECLRLESPAQYVARVAKEEFIWDGVRVPQWSPFLLVLGSANRDETVFADPLHFYPNRKPNPYLSFGKGKHSCIGGHLVSLEMQAAFRVLVENFPEMQIQQSSLNWEMRPAHRWPEKLMVRL